MSYVSKGEKVFAVQDPEHPDCSLPNAKRSDHRLKRFYSTFDKRAWDFCEIIRYRHLYDLMSGSQTCIGVDECHRYVPLEDLIKILMAEKDEYIRKLEECCKGLKGGGQKGDAEQSLQNQVSALTQEVNNSRELLRQAMHKLQNIDEIVNENKKLHCRLRCSEERVKYLEEKKRHLECELADLRSRSQIQIDLDRAQQMLTQVSQQREESVGKDEAALQKLTRERNQLQEKVEQLEKELEEAKKKESEIAMLKKKSQSDSLNIEEMSKENECYKKKLATMKCLEKQIQELKKQGRALADKYKREAQSAAEQMKKMCQAAKELQSLREERDSLRKRVDELSSMECQYKALQRKLQRVDAIIAENEMLNSKVCALDKLEKENEYLRCRLNEIQELEMTASEDKERILQLQCAVADQEEEMKDLLCQIERLTSGRGEEELERLKCELYEKSSKLRLCEEQLAEIPLLEAEIDELRTRLQCCCREFPEKKTGESSYQKMEVRLPASSTGISANYKCQSPKSSSVLGTRREEKVELEGKSRSCQEILLGDKGGSKPPSGSGPSCSDMKEMMSCEEVQCLLQSSKGIISCVLEDMIEHQKEMEELEKCNRAMKDEIEFLKAKMGKADTDALLREVSNLKKVVEEKDAEILRLKQSSAAESASDVELLKDLNRQMKAELEAACSGLKEVAKLEEMLNQEHKARCEAERKLEQGGRRASPSAGLAPTSGDLSSGAGALAEEDPEFDCCKALQKEIDDLKLQILELNKLTGELKKENELLRELQQPCPDFSKELDEKCALENLLALLQAELDAFKGQKLSDECEALRSEVKRLMEQNCQLKALVDCYRQRLDLEKKSNQLAKLGAGTRPGEGSVDESDVDGFGKRKRVKGTDESEVSETESGAPRRVKISDEESGGTSRGPESDGTGGLRTIKSSREESGEREGMSEDEGGPGGASDGYGTDSSRTKGSSRRGVSGLESSEEEGTPGSRPGQLGTPGAISGQPGTPGVISGESGTPGVISGQPGTPGGAPGQPGTPGGAPGQPGTAGGAPGQPGTPGSVPGQPGTAGGAPGQPGTAGSVPGQPGTAEGAPGQPGTAPGQQWTPGAKAGQQGAIPTDPKDMADEIYRLRNLLSEKEAALDNQKNECEEMLKAREAEVAQLKEMAGGAPARGKPGVHQSTSGELPDDVDELKARLKQMAEENAEKLKKLMDQHEKELSNREKAYNDNIAAMKSGYETDIRKLADRHKQSIMKLQGLHEDEVQELNTNYETQMESMQTQSEMAMNDVARGSQAKLRKLAEQHSQEMREMEEKEAKYMDELGELRASLTKSQQEQEMLKRKAQEADGSVSQLKAKHSREMQQHRRSSALRMSLLKEQMEKERRKSQAEVDSLKRKLQEQEKGDGVCDCKFKKKLRKPRDPTCPLDFNEVLEKILEEGLESLTFNEIALVHRKTCCALEGIVMNSNVCPMLEPPVGDSCPHTPLLEADKQQLLSRIFALENEISRKQRQTQEAILNMEVAIRKERCRLQEVKNSLFNEQQKNSELKSLLSSQTKLQTDLRKERDILGNQASLHQSMCLEKSKQLDVEVRTKRSLETEVERLKNQVKQLSLALDTERRQSECRQSEEPDLQLMRMKLDKSSNQEQRLALQLENEAKYRMQLQCQVQALKQSFRQMVNLPAVETQVRAQNPLEAKSAKEKQNFDQIKEKKNKIKSKCGRRNRK